MYTEYLGPHSMGEQLTEQRIALGFGQPLDVDREALVHKQNLTSGHGMREEYGMRNIRDFL